MPASCYTVSLFGPHILLWNALQNCSRRRIKTLGWVAEPCPMQSLRGQRWKIISHTESTRAFFCCCPSCGQKSEKQSGMREGSVMAELKTDLNAWTGLFSLSSFLFTLTTVFVIRSCICHVMCSNTGMLTQQHTAWGFLPNTSLGTLLRAKTALLMHSCCSLCCALFPVLKLWNWKSLLVLLQNSTSSALGPGNPFPPCEFLLCSLSNWERRMRPLLIKGLLCYIWMTFYTKRCFRLAALKEISYWLFM